MQKQWTISRLDCDMQWKVDCTQQPAMTSSEAGPRRSSKALPKAKLAPKKVMVTVWWSAASLTHYFWIPTKPLHLRSMLSKPMRCPENCNTCSSQQNGPSSSPQCLTTCRTVNTSKVEWIGPRPSHSPDLSPTDYYFFKHLNNFLHGKPFHNQQETENVFQEFVKSRGMDFYTTGINKLISHWQKCVDCVMVLILTNKDVFEPSYNDLKFTVWNHN